MPDIQRYETVDWFLYAVHSNTTLGELRTLLREVAEWPDDAWVDCQKISVRRARPVQTQVDGG